MESIIIYIGCDPGSASGAIAAIEDGVLIEYTKIKSSPIGEVDYAWLNYWLAPYKPAIGCIELVHSMPRQGVSSTFKFGKAYGVELAVIGLNVEELIIAQPNTWKTILLGRNGYEKDKKGSVSFIRDRYPEAKIRNHNVAEAVCLALYAMHKKGESGYI